MTQHETVLDYEGYTVGDRVEYGPIDHPRHGVITELTVASRPNPDQKLRDKAGYRVREPMLLIDGGAGFQEALRPCDVTRVQ